MIKEEYKNILSLTSMVKNEAFYITEWIEFHKMVGVEHFYIYDHDSNDNLYEKLSPYIDKGIVTYTKWPDKGPINSVEAYNDSINKHKYETKYMGFIDVDEFIVPIKGESIVKIIESIFDTYKTCGGLGINWRMYGTSYHENKLNGLVIENYKYRANDNLSDNKHIKTICNPRNVIGFATNPHSLTYIQPYCCINEHGIHIPGPFLQNSTCDKIRINHYHFKSKEDYIEKMGKRKAYKITNKYIEERLELGIKNCNEIYDKIMDKYIDELRKKCGLV